MSEPIIVYRGPDGGDLGAYRESEHDEEWAALPRAEYDALVAERDAFGRQFVDMTAKALDAARECDAATARADAADKRAKAAEALVAAAANATSVHADLVALLREARSYVDEAICPYCDPGDPDCEVRKHWPNLLARIDALLGEAPGDDDRRGEDGAWCQGGGRG